MRGKNMGKFSHEDKEKRGEIFFARRKQEFLFIVVSRTWQKWKKFSLQV